MKHVYIINPTAGKKDLSQQLTRQIQKIFNKREAEYVIHITKQAKDAYHIAKTYQNCQEEIRIYCCGGDGTLHEVINACASQLHISVAPIPIGTGNDFTKTFPNASYLELEKLIDAPTQPIDLIKVEDIYCINITNAGLDSRIAYNVNKFKSLPLISGKIAYYLSLIYCFFTSLSDCFELQIDGKDYPSDDYTFVVFANARFYGGSFQPTPNAEIDDGWIDCLFVPKITRRTIIKLLKIYQKGEHLNQRYRHMFKFTQCKQAKFKNNNCKICIDGEIYTMDQPALHIIPKALNLILPIPKDTLQ